jgi:hypothetical protein
MAITYKYLGLGLYGYWNEELQEGYAMDPESGPAPDWLVRFLYPVMVCPCGKSLLNEKPPYGKDIGKEAFEHQGAPCITPLK